MAWCRICFVAVGGGGLIAGVAAYLGDVAPHVKVIGVEYEESACLKAALEANERVVLPHVGLFADGTAVAQIGALPFDIVRLRKSDNSGPIVEPDIVTVNTDEICAAIKDTFDENRSIVEPSGAMALAGIKNMLPSIKLAAKTWYRLFAAPTWTLTAYVTLQSAPNWVNNVKPFMQLLFLKKRRILRLLPCSTGP